MSENLVNIIINTFGNFTGIPFGKEIITFIISLLPILELRGGLLAAGILNLNPIVAYIICIVGNLLPIPFILMFITKILEWMKKTKLFSKIAIWLENKALNKKDSLKKGEFIGLVLFVGIPLPGTGAWTGALLASILRMDKKRAMLAILIGIFIASIIMMILSYGILNNVIYN